MGKRILVVDDEAVVRKSFCRIFASTDIDVQTAPSGHLALEALQHAPFDLVITDLKMPGMNGLEVLKAIKVLQPEVPVILITGYSTVDTAVEAMKSGALDYIAKPFTPEEIKEKVVVALSRARPDEGSGSETVESLGGIIGRSPAMQEVYRRIRQVAPTDSTVLIHGESGTGKELVARAIHDQSHRKTRPFVAVDCTALAENLLESELFGHVKGSFTGAIRTKVGLFKVADGGTLFLDEVSNISLTVQAKLLRVLQEREITPIGGTQPVPIDIRLVTATNRELKAMVTGGSFREDLYFRLNIIPIPLPPLREREGDVPLLADFFLRKCAGELGKRIDGFAPDALAVLEAYAFHGNVRELENIVERAVVLCPGERVRREDLELQDSSTPGSAPTAPRNAEELKYRKQQVREQAVVPVERAFVLDALRRNDWNITRAAEDTGMLRPNFQAMLKKLNISTRDRDG
ncbi:MAG: sigma-54-dependent Fis family transcriptional regulator [Proteobacteria bacterium]|nr:sigma-54-dependent Fis family transcriptional regulator [Pseudomonadota bacterium]